jgi:hypothetical protein
MNKDQLTISKAASKTLPVVFSITAAVIVLFGIILSRGYVAAVPNYRLPIPELGITLSLPQDLHSLTYTVDESMSKTPFVYLSAQSLEEETSEASSRCAAKDGALGALWKVGFDPRKVVEMQSYTIKQLGPNTWLVYQPPQTSCSKDSNVVSQQANLIRQIRPALLDSVQAGSQQ